VVDASRRPSQAMAEHLTTCAACQAELVAYRRLLSALKDLKGVLPPGPPGARSDAAFWLASGPSKTSWARHGASPSAAARQVEASARRAHPSGQAHLKSLGQHLGGARRGSGSRLALVGLGAVALALGGIGAVLAARPSATRALAQLA